MITETNTVNFRRKLGELLSQIQYRHDSGLFPVVPDVGLMKQAQPTS